MIAKPSKIRPLFMQCSIYFFILHLLLQFSETFMTVDDALMDTYKETMPYT